MRRAIDRPLHGGLVVKAGCDHVDREGRERAACCLPRIGGMTRQLAGPYQHPHVVVAVDEQSDDVVADQPRASCDQAVDWGRRLQGVAG